MFLAWVLGVLFGLLFDLCRRGHTTRTAALLTLAAFGLAIVTLALRPQLFGMVVVGLGRAHDLIAERWGEDVAQRLVVDNPRAVVADRPLPGGQDNGRNS